jgi:hypothetical protein
MELKRMKSLRNRPLALWLSLVMPWTVLAQTAPTGRPPQAVATTQLVSKYLQLERDLEDHLSERQAAQVKTLLAPHFSVRDAQTSSMEQSQWLAREQSKSKAVRGISALQVVPVDGHMVVSFLRSDPRKHCPSWVVDMWSDGTNLLNTRFETLACDKTSAQRSTSTQPSGKE